MADLEDLVLLEKTHSSSGRIPSEKGYRYYVDHVIGPSIKDKEVNLVTHIIEDDMYELQDRSEEHTSELQSRGHLVCRLLLEKKKKKNKKKTIIKNKRNITEE